MPRRNANGRNDERRATEDDATRRLRRHLEFLGPTLTVDQLDTRLAWATEHRPGATGLLERVLGIEVAHKLEQRIARRVDTSGPTERKTLEAFDWDFQPGIDKSLILELARFDFVRRRDDLVITDQAGTGKSHILKALALRACEQGISMRYARCVDLLDDPHKALADGSYARRLKATSATRPSPPPSSTDSRCTPYASTSTVRAIASTSPRTAPKSEPPRPERRNTGHREGARQPS